MRRPFLDLIATGVLLPCLYLPAELSAQSGVPSGWLLRGSNPSAYSVSVQEDAARNSAVATLRATDQSPDGFGTLMQTIQAGDYRGKRIRLTAYVRSQGVAEWSGLWMRIDGPGGSSQPLAFDNMQDRPIRGTVDWTQHTVVLEVPQTAERIAFGILLAGGGRVDVDEFVLEEVVTDTQSDLPRAPRNPGFQQ